MKKLLIIGPRAFPADFVGTSGVETYVEQTIGQLLKLRPDLEIEILTRKKYQDAVEHYSPHPRVNIQALWSYPGRVLEAVSYSLFGSLKACFSDADIIWCHTAGMAIFSWLPALCGKKIWVTIHSLDWQRKKWHNSERFVFKFAFGWVIKFISQIELFAVSEALAKRIRVFTDKPCQVAHPGLLHPLRRRGVTVSREYLLYLGRLVPEKRVEWLLQFCNTRKIECVIVGTHGNTPDYERKLRAKYTSPSITWYGSAIGREKWDLFAGAKYLVLPSELEGFPITILEALAVETPCLLAGGILPEEIEKLSLVYTFAASSQRSFNTTLSRLVNRKQPQRISKNDWRTLVNYSWERTAQTYAAAT